MTLPGTPPSVATINAAIDALNAHRAWMRHAYYVLTTTSISGIAFALLAILIRSKHRLEFDLARLRRDFDRATARPDG